MSKCVRGMHFGMAEREPLTCPYSTMKSLGRLRGRRLVRTRITPPIDAHYMIDVRLLCTLNFEADCVDFLGEQSFKGAVTREKYRTATFQVSIILGNADLEFAVSYRGEELGRVQADYVENL